MITIAHLAARASRPLPALPGASPALTHEPPDAGSLRSDRRPGSQLDQSSQTRRSAPSTRSRVPLRRKRPAGTQGSGDIDKPSAVTERACSIGDHALSEIDAPGPHLTPACGGRLRRPRTEEWPLPDDHPRSRCQLGALDPRSPITEEGLTTAPLPPPRLPERTRSPPADRPAEAQNLRHFWRAVVDLARSAPTGKPSPEAGFSAAPRRSRSSSAPHARRPVRRLAAGGLRPGMLGEDRTHPQTTATRSCGRDPRVKEPKVERPPEGW
jgi:hypothetical protein